MSNVPASGSIKVAVVGFAGHQGLDYLSALQASERVQVTALADRRVGSPEVDRLAPGVPRFRTARDMVAQADFDVALVAVPHAEHYRTTVDLLRAGKHVLKEKPLAASSHEAVRLVAAARESGVALRTLTQRPFRKDFRSLLQMLDAVGPVYWFDYSYHLSLPEPTSGWRASRSVALGGVLLDMGYHAVDILNRAFGMPENVSSSLKFKYDDSRKERLEDLAGAHLHYPRSDLSGALTISRHAHAKHESFVVHGAAGTLTISPRQGVVVRFDSSGRTVDRIESPEGSSDVTRTMLHELLDTIGDPHYGQSHTSVHLQNVRVCEMIYGSNVEPNGHTPAPPRTSTKPEVGDLT